MCVVFFYQKQGQVPLLAGFVGRNRKVGYRSTFVGRLSANNGTWSMIFRAKSANKVSAIKWTSTVKYLEDKLRTMK